MRSTFRILFFLKRDRQKRNGKVPVFCRITICGEEARFSIKQDVDPALWSVKEGKASGRSSEAFQINALLDSVRTTLIHIYQDIQLNELDVTAEKVKNQFLGLSPKSYTLLALFQKHNDDVLKLVGISKSRTTWQKYERTKHHLADFLKSRYRVSDLSLKEINHMFLTDFEAYLKTACGCNANTTAKFMQSFKRIVLIARNNGWMHYDPFVNYPIRISQVDRGYLTEEEIKAIMSKPFITPRLEQVRDVFIFSCFCGLAYIDMANLRQENIVRSFDNQLWISGKREKTGVAFHIPLLDINRKILHKYEGKLSKGRLLPVLSNQKMNAYLKEIADLCGINKNITFHCARHTFATYLLTKGVSIESVSKMLGHTNIKTTQIYARILDTKIGEDMSQFADRIKGLEEIMASNL